MRKLISPFFNTIQKRLIFGFLAICLTFSCSLLVSVHFLTRIESVIGLRTSSSSVESQILKLINNDARFINESTVSDAFYINCEDELTAKHREMHENVLQQILKLHNLIGKGSAVPKDSVWLLKLRERLERYQAQYRFLHEQQLLLGHKDYGLIGVMREKAHALQESENIAIATVLSLRRHEKDYLLRRRTEYLSKFEEIYKKERHILPPNEVRLLTEYYRYFLKVVDVSQVIHDPNTGALRKMHEESERMFEVTQNFSDTILASTDGYMENIRVLWYSTIVFSLIIGLFFSYKFSRLLVRPVRILAKQMKEFVLDDNQLPIAQQKFSSTEEINHLTSSYEELANKIMHQYHELIEQKSKLEIQYEEMKKLNSELDSFVYSASHELRSPLMSVTGLLSIMKLENEENTEQLTYIELLQATTERMDSTIEDIVSYAYNKNVEVQISKISPKEFFYELFDFCKLLDGGREVKYNLQFDSEVDCFAVDLKRWRIVFENLITNAVKYRRQDVARSKVSVRCRIDGDKFTVQITDNGKGIPEESKVRVFDMFYRADEDVIGSGLGLYLVKECLQKLNGHIALDSIEGKGTVVTVSLPLSNNVQVEKQATASLLTLT